MYISVENDGFCNYIFASGFTKRAKLLVRQKFFPLHQTKKNRRLQQKSKNPFIIPPPLPHLQDPFQTNMSTKPSPPRRYISSVPWRPDPSMHNHTSTNSVKRPSTNAAGKAQRAAPMSKETLSALRGAVALCTLRGAPPSPGEDAPAASTDSTTLGDAATERALVSPSSTPAGADTTPSPVLLDDLNTSSPTADIKDYEKHFQPAAPPSASVPRAAGLLPSKKAVTVQAPSEPAVPATQKKYLMEECLPVYGWHLETHVTVSGLVNMVSVFVDPEELSKEDLSLDLPQGDSFCMGHPPPFYDPTVNIFSARAQQVRDQQILARQIFIGIKGGQYVFVLVVIIYTQKSAIYCVQLSDGSYIESKRLADALTNVDLARTFSKPKFILYHVTGDRILADAPYLVPDDEARRLCISNNQLLVECAYQVVYTRVVDLKMHDGSDDSMIFFDKVRHKKTPADTKRAFNEALAKVNPERALHTYATLEWLA